MYSVLFSSDNWLFSFIIFLDVIPFLVIVKGKTAMGAVPFKIVFMTKLDVINAVSKATELPKKDVDKAITSAVSVISRFLSEGKRVHISKLGTFYVRNVDTRMARNPQTGDAVKVDPHNRVGFKCSTTLKRSVN